ncbi:MAG: GDSL-type esterase/lipase family protein [Pseudomonadota bacterium]
MEQSKASKYKSYLLLAAAGAFALALAVGLALRWVDHNNRNVILLKHRVENLFTPEGATVFMGDSLVSSADWNEYLPGHNIVNRGVYADDTKDMLIVLPDVLALKPAQLVILIGINDLNKRLDFAQSAATLTRIFNLIDEHASEIRVVLIELLPTNDSWARQPEQFSVERYNRFLQQQADERQYTFARIGSSLGEGHGGLNPRFTSDGIHLNSKGYSVLGTALKPYLFVGNSISN